MSAQIVSVSAHKITAIVVAVIKNITANIASEIRVRKNAATELLPSEQYVFIYDIQMRYIQLFLMLLLLLPLRLVLLQLKQCYQ